MNGNRQVTLRVAQISASLQRIPRIPDRLPAYSLRQRMKFSAAVAHKLPLFVPQNIKLDAKRFFFHPIKFHVNIANFRATFFFTPFFFNKINNVVF